MGNHENGGSYVIDSPGVWYRVVGTGGTIYADLTTSVPGYDTTLTIFTGTCGSLTCVTANDDVRASPFLSKAGFRTVLGQDYYMLIHGFGTSDVGATGDSSTTLISTALASCAVVYTHYDTWYSYTPVCNGTLAVDTCGTFDTVLSLHTGCPGAVSNQIVGACSQDGGVGCNTANTCTSGDSCSSGAVAAGTITFPGGCPVRLPNIDDGGELLHGNHQIHPSIKECDPANPTGPGLAKP